jgi:IclR family mhp operon transcriptional activator
MPSFKPVIALSRGLDVLRVVNQEKLTTVGSIHKATGLDKATVVRMLETLENQGYVMRDTERAAYAPTGRTLLLSQGYDRHLWIGSIADPILQEVRDQVGWPVDIALFDRDAMIISQTLQERGSVFFVRRRPGFRIPVLTTSLGRAYLAYCSDDEHRAIVKRLAAIPGPSTELARQPERLARAIEDVRSRGYALTDPSYSHEMFDDKVWAIGVPVRNEQTVFAAINVMLLHGAMTEEAGIRQFLEPLRRTADRIAGELTARSALTP